MTVYFISDAMLFEWRVWRHIGDALEGRFVATRGSCDSCTTLTSDDLNDGGLLLVMDTSDSFSHVDIFVHSSGMRPNFDSQCDAHALPATMMTMAVMKGRLAAGDCDPTCGSVKQCKMVDVVSNTHKFHCDCSPHQCQDVGLYIGRNTLIFENKTMEICHPLIGV